jgi:ferritin-like metal-binding protein YciE
VKTESVKLLGDTLEEEKATDRKLSLIAEEKLAAGALGR